MKKLFFAMLLLTGNLIIENHLVAQVSINVNIGNQPAWAPEGHDEAQYYYLPDMDIYYDVPAHQFVYLNNGKWSRSSALPAAYQKYDLYQVHKVPINEKNAYLKHTTHQQQYASFKGKRDQTPIRDSRDGKYASNKNNWQNQRFQKVNNNAGKSNNSNKSTGDNGRY